MNQDEVLEGQLPRMSCRFRRSVIGKWGFMGGRVRKAGWWCGGGLSLLAPSGIAPALSETRRSGSTRALCRPPVQLSGERVRARRQVAFFCRLTVGEGLLPRESGDETGEEPPEMHRGRSSGDVTQRADPMPLPVRRRVPS